MIRLLVADDSATIRHYLNDLFRAQDDFEVQCASNGEETRRALHQFAPDVVCLDIEMPDTDGLTVLSHIMVERPCPVVMFSALTAKGTAASLQALALGAVDYILKPADGKLDAAQLGAEIVAKVRLAAAAHVITSWQARLPRVDPILRPAHAHERLVLIGVSTGGPRTLEGLLSALPADFPYPVVVAQHMPAYFTAPFAQRLDQLCALSVVEVSRAVAPRAGTVYVARGGADLQLLRRASGLVLQPQPESDQYRWHPSVQMLVESALQHVPAKQLVGVMLTGMGDDGASAMHRLFQLGGTTIAEAEESAVVYGMPRALIELGGATHVLPAWAIADALVALSGHLPQPLTLQE
ncbi:Chemotaxis response regulator protein-glutamate methylesterase [Andreprevotia sp. IGB-42]|uniref:chemotaxis-specific protein-glutamate methyltransferase CheB n=1 Tax=Andreprevotia sp. IGB-42 TaxID=2497473 RepID=UPI00135BA642|nr:chemotaxis-specific protein-glutamate methyltransferase CheB [Andreprevotia sp. IGB-42]KAF0811754.1 Chemotaxis response regulator protein-glutamate methylesterase [Andreprevotia sp. IGB-42]